jgi:hypothetical protein
MASIGNRACMPYILAHFNSQLYSFMARIRVPTQALFQMQAGVGFSQFSAVPVVPQFISRKGRVACTYAQAGMDACRAGAGAHFGHRLNQLNHPLL